MAGTPSSDPMGGRKDLTVKRAGDFQPSLFETLPDKPLTGPGERRSRMGAIAEQIVCAALPVVPIAGGGAHDIVFDAEWGRSLVEIKNVRRSSSIPIYKWRRGKDRAAMRDHDLIYLVCVHSCRDTGGTLSDLWRAMAEHLEDVYVLPASRIHEGCRGKPYSNLYRHQGGGYAGYRREGYRKGYQLLPVKWIRSQEYLGHRIASGEINGLKVSFRVHRHADLAGRRDLAVPKSQANPS